MPLCFPGPKLGLQTFSNYCFREHLLAITSVCKMCYPRPKLGLQTFTTYYLRERLLAISQQDAKCIFQTKVGSTDFHSLLFWRTITGYYVPNVFSGTKVASADIHYLLFWRMLNGYYISRMPNVLFQNYCCDIFRQIAAVAAGSSDSIDCHLWYCICRIL